MLINFMHKKMARLLKTSAVSVHVQNKANGDQYVFNVGYTLQPPMNLELTEEGFTAILWTRLNGSTPVLVAWDAVLSVQPYQPTVKFV